VIHELLGIGKQTLVEKTFEFYKQNKHIFLLYLRETTRGTIIFESSISDLEATLWA